MAQACDQWLETDHGKLLAELPMDPARAVEGWRKRLKMAYLAGYLDGRKRDNT